MIIESYHQHAQPSMSTFFLSEFNLNCTTPCNYCFVTIIRAHLRGHYKHRSFEESEQFCFMFWWGQFMNLNIKLVYMSLWLVVWVHHKGQHTGGIWFTVKHSYHSFLFEAQKLTRIVEDRCASSSGCATTLFKKCNNSITFTPPINKSVYLDFFCRYDSLGVCYGVSNAMMLCVRAREWCTNRTG